jgi:hypothetical protein
MSAHDHWNAHILQICDLGVVVAEADLQMCSTLEAALPAISGLEIRIKASGHPFVLKHIYLAHFPEEEDLGGVEMDENVPERIAVLDEQLSALSTKPTSKVVEELEKQFSSCEIEYVRQSIHQPMGHPKVSSIVAQPDFTNRLERWFSNRVQPRLVDVWGAHLVTNWSFLTQIGINPLESVLKITDEWFCAADCRPWPRGSWPQRRRGGLRNRGRGGAIGSSIRRCARPPSVGAELGSPSGHRTCG